MDIKGIDKGKLIASLHNWSRAVGMGVLHDIGRNMTDEEGTKIYEKYKDAAGRVEFDYLLGRPLKVKITENVLEGANYYDDCNGKGSAEMAVLEALTKP